jgi:hypothetical protein
VASDDEEGVMADMTRALELAQGIYERSWVGCCLHIVLDDGNVGTSHVECCVGWAREAGHADCVELATMMLGMTEGEREWVREATPRLKLPPMECSIRVVSKL